MKDLLKSLQNTQDQITEKLTKFVFEGDLSPAAGPNPHGPQFPTGTATKMRNHLARHYEGASQRQFISASNPYESHQSLDASIPEEQGTRLKTDLENQGWKENSMWLQPGHYNYDHPGGQHNITIYAAQNGRHSVRVVGPKPSKPRTMFSQYD